MRALFAWASCFPSSWVIASATLLGLGKVGKAPGTLGSIVGVLLVAFIYARLPLVPFIVIAVLQIFFAIGICGEAEERMQKRDPGEVILDELVAIPLCFIGLRQVMAADAWTCAVFTVLGFIAFRFFDILKPLGIKRIQDLHGGFGVVADDVLAALYSAIVLNALLYLARSLGWVTT